MEFTKATLHTWVLDGDMDGDTNSDDPAVAKSRSSAHPSQ